jgi:hypothetical protein
MGAVAGRLPDGSVGYAEGGAPKDVEGKGGFWFVLLFGGAFWGMEAVAGCVRRRRVLVHGAGGGWVAFSPFHETKLISQPQSDNKPGVATILKTMRMYMAPEKRRVQEVVPMRSAEDLAVWARTFRMAVAPSEDGRGAVVTGSAEAVRCLLKNGRFGGAVRTAAAGFVSQKRAPGNVHTLSIFLSPMHQRDHPNHPL